MSAPVTDNSKQEDMKIPPFTASVLGASGNTGRRLVHLLQESAACQKIHVFSRRPTDLFKDQPKVVEHVVNLDKMEEEVGPHVQGSNVAFSVIGIGKDSHKMAEAEVHKVEVQYPSEFAKACKVGGVKAFGLMTAPVADSKSSIMHFRIVGQKEESVIAQKLASLSIFRPSTILNNTNTPGWAPTVMKMFQWMMPDKYHAIDQNDLSRAIFEKTQQSWAEVASAAEGAEPRVDILSWAEMKPYFKAEDHPAH